MIDLFFNLGPGGLSKFVKFLDAMSKGEWVTAAAELTRSKWHGQVGKRAIRIEAIIETGKWP